MQFSGTVYRGDDVVARDVLGTMSRHGRQLHGMLVPRAEDQLAPGWYVLLSDSGLIREILVVRATGGPTKSQLVEFVDRHTVEAFCNQCIADGIEALVGSQPPGPLNDSAV